jgi:hypothetical protein
MSPRRLRRPTTRAERKEIAVDELHLTDVRTVAVPVADQDRAIALKPDYAAAYHNRATAQADGDDLDAGQLGQPANHVPADETAGTGDCDLHRTSRPGTAHTNCPPHSRM